MGAPGKLKTVSGGQGGKTTFKYKALDKTKNPGIKQSMSVIKEARVCDGITYTNPVTTPIVTSYEFEEGVYDIPSKEFRGFGKVTTTAPTGDIKIEQYYTDSYRPGKLYFLINKNKDGAVFNTTFFDYTVYTPAMRGISINPDVKLILPTEEHKSILDGASSPLKYTKESYEYTFDTNGYINLSRKINYGEVDSSFTDTTPYDYVKTETTYENHSDIVYSVSVCSHIIGLVNEKSTWGTRYLNPAVVLQSKIRNTYFPTSPPRFSV